MRRLPLGGWHAARRFTASERGAVTLEFMLWLPLLLLWIGATTTAFDLFRAANLTERAATAASDVLVRLDHADASTLENVTALQRAVGPRATGHRLRVASLTATTDAYLVDWQWSSEAGLALEPWQIEARHLPPPEEGTSLLYVETRMRRAPVIRLGFGERQWTIVQTAKPLYAASVSWKARAEDDVAVEGLIGSAIVQ
ncbi:MAG: hypothetical protein AAF698_05665 [Pseudomonadota bacterium]